MTPTPNLSLRYTQNFLTSSALVKKIVALADIEPDTAVLEIGPGTGIITAELLRRVGPDGQLTAVELDPQLIPPLRTKFADQPQLRLIHADILRFDLGQLPAPYTVFANIPFSITSDLLEHLFTPPTGPTAAHLILQTDTLIATNQHGMRGETLKSLLIQPLYTIKPVHHFAHTDFRPAPAVATALFAFVQRPEPLFDPALYPLYCDFLAFVAPDRAGEGAWRQLFSPKQTSILASQTELVLNRGIKMQSVAGITAAFETFVRLCGNKHGRVSGAFSQLRETQARTTQHNQRHGHRSPKQRRPNRRKSE